MTTDQNLMLHTKLSGFRLVVLANRFGCDTSFSRALHDRLMEGLDAARARIRTIMALEHQSHPIHGVQFHPESVLTPEGMKLIENFTAIALRWNEKNRQAA